MNFGMRIADFGLKNSEVAIRNLKSAIRNRHVFLASILALALSSAAARGADLLQVLKPNDFERLKLDFNSNRSKVRLFFVLSPT